MINYNGLYTTKMHHTILGGKAGVRPGYMLGLGSRVGLSIGIGLGYRAKGRVYVDPRFYRLG